MTDKSAMDALFGAAAVGSDQSLSRVAQLVAEESDLLAEKATGEAMASSAKERLTEIYHNRLPEAMLAAGTTEFKNEDGLKVTLDFAVDGALGSAKTAEEIAAKNKKLDLIEGLEGGAEIIKFEVTAAFPKELTAKAKTLQAKIVEWLEASNINGVTVTVDRTIHHQTLKKFIKEKMEAGHDVPLEALEMWYGQIAKVKRPKAAS